MFLHFYRIFQVCFAFCHQGLWLVALFTSSLPGCLPSPYSCGRAWPRLSCPPGSPWGGVRAGRGQSHCRACSHYHCTWCCCSPAGQGGGTWRCLDLAAHLCSWSEITDFNFTHICSCFLAEQWWFLWPWQRWLCRWWWEWQQYKLPGQYHPESLWKIILICLSITAFNLGVALIL